MRGRGKKKGKKSLNCTGYELPDIPKISYTEQIDGLEDCCCLLEIEDEILLYEQLETKEYYWLILEADRDKLVVCNLEQYANELHSRDKWSGRKADHLARGLHEGHCYLVIIELRHRIINKEQVKDKFKQVKQSIDRVVSELQTEIQNSTLFAQACNKSKPCRILGLIIAPAGIHNYPQKQRIQKIENENYKAIITMISPEQVQNCKISWSNLIDAVVPPDQ